MCFSLRSQSLLLQVCTTRNNFSEVSPVFSVSASRVLLGEKLLRGCHFPYVFSPWAVSIYSFISVQSVFEFCKLPRWILTNAVLSTDKTVLLSSISLQAPVFTWILGQLISLWLQLSDFFKKLWTYRFSIFLLSLWVWAMLYSLLNI